MKSVPAVKSTDSKSVVVAGGRFESYWRRFLFSLMFSTLLRCLSATSSAYNSCLKAIETMKYRGSAENLSEGFKAVGD